MTRAPKDEPALRRGLRLPFPGMREITLGDLDPRRYPATCGRSRAARRRPCRSARPWRGPPGACGLARAHRRRQRPAAHRRDRPRPGRRAPDPQDGGRHGERRPDRRRRRGGTALARRARRRQRGRRAARPRPWSPAAARAPPTRRATGSPAIWCGCPWGGRPSNGSGRAGHHGPAQGPRSGRGAGAVALLADHVPPLGHRLGGTFVGQNARLLFDLLVTSVPLPSLGLRPGWLPAHRGLPCWPSLAQGQSLAVAVSDVPRPGALRARRRRRCRTRPGRPGGRGDGRGEGAAGRLRRLARVHAGPAEVARARPAPPSGLSARGSNQVVRIRSFVPFGVSWSPASCRRGREPSPRVRPTSWKRPRTYRSASSAGTLPGGPCGERRQVPVVRGQRGRQRLEDVERRSRPRRAAPRRAGRRGRPRPGAPGRSRRPSGARARRAADGPHDGHGGAEQTAHLVGRDAGHDAEHDLRP